MSGGENAVAEARALIADYFAAFNDRDITGMLSLLDDDVAHDINQGGREIGREAFKQFLIHMNRCYREEVGDLVIMVDGDGLRAAAEFTVRGTYEASDEGLPPARGQTYSLQAGTFFAIDGGRIARVTTCYNLKDWIAQVSSQVS